MNDLNENKILEEELAKVSGGVTEQYSVSSVKVKSIAPYWIRVTASDLNCRYSPNGIIAKSYRRGHRLKVNGITYDGKWYRLKICVSEGEVCDGYIFKQYTERC